MSVYSTRVHELFHAMAKIELEGHKAENVVVCATKDGKTKGYCGLLKDAENLPTNPINLMAGIVHSELDYAIESFEDAQYFVDSLKEAYKYEDGEYNDLRESILLVEHNAESLSEGSDHARLLAEFPEIDLEELLDKTLDWMIDNAYKVIRYASAWQEVYDLVLKDATADIISVSNIEEFFIYQCTKQAA